MLLGLAVYAIELDAYGVSRLSSYPLQGALFQIDKCALEFAAEHPADGFAKTLEQLGAGGSNCTSKKFVRGKYAGFTLQYSQRTNVSATNGFVVFARAPRLGGWLSGSRKVLIITPTREGRSLRGIGMLQARIRPMSESGCGTKVSPPRMFSGMCERVSDIYTGTGQGNHRWRSMFRMRA